MNRHIAGLLLLGLATASPMAFAQSAYVEDGYDDSRWAQEQPYDSQEAYYDEARVVRVDPVLDGAGGGDWNRPQRCYQTSAPGRYESDAYRSNPGGRYGNDGYGGTYGRDMPPSGTPGGRNMATIVGGIAGAVLGSKMGSGSGTYAATAVGSMLGSMAGREIYDQSQRERYVRGGSVRVCEPEPVYPGYARQSRGANLYDVTYEYNGRRFTRRMDHHPGDFLRVRVDVAPE